MDKLPGCRRWLSHADRRRCGSVLSCLEGPSACVLRRFRATIQAQLLSPSPTDSPRNSPHPRDSRREASISRDSGPASGRAPSNVASPTWNVCRRGCHVAVRRVRSVSISGIVRPLRLRSATCPSPRRGSARCSGSRAPAPRRDSSRATLPSTTRSTSNAISRQPKRTARSAPRRWTRGGPQSQRPDNS